MPEEKLECRECFVTGDTNIVQSNSLIERKQKLSLPATQLLFTLTGMINKDDEDLMEYKVDVSYFAELWGIDLKLAYQAVADALTELREKGINDHTINPKTGKKVFTTVGFISFGRYEHGEGFATVRIEPELKPHYIALQKEFTRFSLDNILQLQENGAQVNAMRTYELLKQYQKLGKRKLSITEYKEQLGLITYDNKGNVIKEKYKNSVANLKIKVLDPAIEKINCSTDIFVTYELEGRGKKACVIFSIEAQSMKKPVVAVVEPEEPKKAPKSKDPEQTAVRVSNGDENEELGMFESEDKLAHERDLREEICEGFQNEFFDEFTLDHLKEFAELAKPHLDKVAIHDLMMEMPYNEARDFVLCEYVKRKILYVNAEGANQSRLGYIRKAIAEDYR